MYRTLFLLGLAFFSWMGSGCRSDAPDADARSPLVCTPDTLGRGGALQLELTTPHAGDLAIVDPGGTLYFAFRNGVPDPLLTPAPDVSDFRKVTRLRLPVDSTEMKPYAYDAHAAVPVFRRTGTYSVRLGRQLADSDTAEAQCTVYYAPDATP